MFLGIFTAPGFQVDIHHFSPFEAVTPFIQRPHHAHTDIPETDNPTFFTAAIVISPARFVPISQSYREMRPVSTKGVNKQ